MALNDKPRGRWWSWLHFLVRFLGLTGLLAAAVGAVLIHVVGLLPPWDGKPVTWGAVSDYVEAALGPARQALSDALAGAEDTDRLAGVAVALLVIGAPFVLLALLAEALSVLRFAAGRRSAFGSNAVAQVVLAAALVVGVNVFAQWQGNYRRFDLTRDQRFTLPAEVQGDLGKLQGETTIVVYQMHQTLGFRQQKKLDRYESAAERKVIEKAKDLVEQFREFGPQFKVVVLDSADEDYADHVKTLPEPLREAIDRAPEDSIFFHAGGKVQRLSFNDFYALDKAGSQDVDGGRGNLLLRYHGVKPFADRVLNIDERRPRVAVGVIHEVLSLQGGTEDLGMTGVKKSLEANGFETRDLLLKKWDGPAGPEPATYTFEESKLEQLDDQITDLQDAISRNDTSLKELEKRREEWAKEPLDKLADTELGRAAKRRFDLTSDKDFNEDVRKRVLASLDESLGVARAVVPAMRERFVKELDSLRKEREGVAKAEEPLAEQRRLNDLRAKTARALADCDLLILPRATLFNVARGESIPNRLYKLDPAQVAAIRDFVRSGKPLLACLGPVNDPPGRPDPDAGSDGLEEMLAGLGLHFSRQTVLYDVESKSFGQRRSGLVIGGTSVEVPPLRFNEWAPGTGLPPGKHATAAEANPLRESLRLTARSLGNTGTLDLRLRHPRPVYYDPQLARLPGALGMWAFAPDAGGVAGVSWGSLFLFGRPGRARTFEPEFLMTDAGSWNEGQPFPTRERTPHYEPEKPDEPVTDPYDARRTGPFPVGIAVEVPNWYSTTTSEAPPLRVAAIGQGGIFIGRTLDPAREKLLLDTCNWLLGRDEQITQQGKEWKYPRVPLDDRSQALWRWGAVFGLPLLFAFLGLVVMMVRHTR
ncbi:MAG TPA: hypothetical protein VKA46_08500 [Gemmataceae bacterium]|nr:hypothetical protein [Gemmataceae bacterium]